MNLVSQFKAHSAALPFALTDGQIESLDRFHTLLVQWNESMNLVSRKSLDSVFLHHIVDSLWISQTVLETRGTLPLIDVGSGGGFPGIMLAILEPELPITLFEKATKKQSFLSVVVQQLGLTRVSIEGLLPRQERPVYACSRAAIGADEFFVFFRKMLVAGSRALRCAGGERDLSQAGPGFTLVEQRKYTLSPEAGDRTTAVYERVPRGTNDES